MSYQHAQQELTEAMEQTGIIDMNEFETLLTQSLNGLFEMVDVYINGDDMDRDLIDKLNGR